MIPNVECWWNSFIGCIVNKYNSRVIIFKLTLGNSYQIVHTTPATQNTVNNKYLLGFNYVTMFKQNGCVLLCLYNCIT